MSLLPSESDATAEDADPRVVGVESDDADELLSALSSATARSLLCALHEEPAPPAELATRVDTSLQNAQYHLEKLETAGAIQVVDTAYSQKGREMDVYAPADQPLVIFAGDQNESTSIRTALTRLLGGFGILALASAAVQGVADGGFGRFFGGAPAGADAAGTATPTVAQAAAARTATPAPEGTPAPAATPEAAEVATETAAAGGADAAAGLPPGLLFFLGGATVLLVGFLAWYLGE
ncbi:ArsR family transcriptional regulator [Halobacteriales archaeon QH_1_68_42]|nr:MAG: ArsR family transcriptional regulator [Halobacteriales archaeon QH_1_68_42]